MRYRAKPVEIEAIRFLGPFSYDEICDEWDGFGEAAYMFNGFLRIRTPEGVMSAGVGDYIIKGTHGEFYPCNSDVFQHKYEPCQ